MKIAGISPKGHQTFLDPDPEEPLGIEYILAVAQRAGHEIELFISGMMSLDDTVKQVTSEKLNVVGISVCTRDVPDALYLAEAIKRALPKTIIVAGGPHPSAVPEFACEPAIDFCVIGEGEETFIELLAMIEGSRNYDLVNGIAFQKGDRLIITNPRQRIASLDNLPFPIRDRRFYLTDSKACSLMYPAPSKIIGGASLICSRGCPNNCDFCSSAILWQMKVRHRSVLKVINEIQFLQKEYGTNFIFLEDLSFSLNPRYAEDFCREIIRQEIKISWWCQTNVGTINKELLAIMKQAGCHAIAFGVESLNDESLERMGKAHAQTIDQTKLAIDLANEAGMLVWGYYMIGFGWETKESILTSTQKLPELGIHRLRLGIVTPFPGCQWYREIDKSLLDPDLSLYDTQHLVYQHPTISPTEMEALMWEVYRSFYHSPTYKKRVEATRKKYPYFGNSFDEFLHYIYQNV